MSILENRCDSNTYSGYSARKLFPKNFKGAPAKKRIIDKLNRAAICLRSVPKEGDVAPSRSFITLERNPCVTNAPKTLVAFFDENRKKALARIKFKRNIRLALMGVGSLKAVLKEGDVSAPLGGFITLERNLHVTGTPKALMATFEDLSEEKKIEKEEHNLEAGKSFSFYKFFTYIIEEIERLELSGIKRKISKLGRAVKSIFQRIARALDNVPEARQPELLQLIENFAKKVQHEPIKPLPQTPAEAKELGIQTYKEFTKTEKSKDGKECLKQNWGHWLKAFTPTLNRDYMCQADLRKLDEPLLIRLTNTYTAAELNKFLPNRSLLNQQIAQTITEEERRVISRSNSMIKRSPLIT